MTINVRGFLLFRETARGIGRPFECTFYSHEKSWSAGRPSGSLRTGPPRHLRVPPGGTPRPCDARLLASVHSGRLGRIIDRSECAAA
jgi:hypothetical protein